MDKLIINAAITGMVPTKHDNPNVPISPVEIIADAKRCYDSGASIVHLHPRDEDGRPSSDEHVHRQIIHGVRKACPRLIVSGTTSGRVHKEFEQRSAALSSLPDMASLTLGSMNFPKEASVNTPAMIRQLADSMTAHSVTPEMEFFEIGMIDYARDYLIPKDILRPPLYANLLLGSLGSLSATPDNLCAMVRALPSGTTWAATGIGRFQFSINCLAVTMGGHVRVGLEDCLYYDSATRRLATNAGLIDRVVNVARAIGRDIATPDEARRMIGLKQVGYYVPEDEKALSLS